MVRAVSLGCGLWGVEMRYEDALLQAVEELNKSHPEWNVAYLALMLRAGQLTTDTSKCEKCGSGG